MIIIPNKQLVFSTLDDNGANLKSNANNDVSIDQSVKILDHTNEKLRFAKDLLNTLKNNSENNLAKNNNCLKNDILFTNKKILNCLHKIDICGTFIDFFIESNYNIDQDIFEEKLNVSSMMICHNYIDILINNLVNLNNGLNKNKNVFFKNKKESLVFEKMLNRIDINLTKLSDYLLEINKNRVSTTEKC